VREAELDFATGIQIGWIAWVVLDFGGGCGIAHSLEGGTGCVPIGFSASIEGGAHVSGSSSPFNHSPAASNR
jgi:hypothetical protein